jgi:hypothetical protein
MRVLVLAVAALAFAIPVRAQEPNVGSRAELLAQLREQKAKRLRPYEPKGIEKALLYIEENRIMERLTIADGWYPRFGGLTTGGGFAGGAGYRKHLLDDRLFLNGSAAISTKAYKQVVANASYPALFDGLVEVGGTFRWNDFPQEDFFGLGNDSDRDRRTNYALESTDISGVLALKPFRWTRIGAEIGYFSPTLSAGTDRRFPSTDLLFSDAEAPGLLEEAPYVYKTLFVEVDYRDQPGNPRSGGLWRAKYGAWNESEFNRYDFGRFDGEIAHFFPISSAAPTRCAASRSSGSATRTSSS